MGLSRDDTPRMDTLQAAIDLAGALKALIANPKVLEQAAKDAYALSEQEQKRAESARENIKEYQDAIAEQRRNDIALDKKSALLDDRAKDIAAKEVAIAASQSVLNKNIAAYQDDNAKLTQLKAQLDVRETATAQKEAALATREAALNAREAKVDNFEDSLKEKAEKLRTITEGL